MEVPGATSDRPSDPICPASGLLSPVSSPPCTWSNKPSGWPWNPAPGWSCSPCTWQGGPPSASGWPCDALFAAMLGGNRPCDAPFAAMLGNNGLGDRWLGALLGTAGLGSAPSRGPCRASAISPSARKHEGASRSSVWACSTMWRFTRSA
eukprot:1157049-Pelagomonas_calceolata.AAC.3